MNRSVVAVLLIAVLFGGGVMWTGIRSTSLSMGTVETHLRGADPQTVVDWTFDLKNTGPFTIELTDIDFRNSGINATYEFGSTDDRVPGKSEAQVKAGESVRVKVTPVSIDCAHLRTDKNALLVATNGPALFDKTVHVDAGYYKASSNGGITATSRQEGEFGWPAFLAQGKCNTAEF